MNQSFKRTVNFGPNGRKEKRFSMGWNPQALLPFLERPGANDR